MLLPDRRLSVRIGPKVFITPLTTDGHYYIYLQVAGFLILWGTKKLDSKKKQCRKLYRLRFASAFVPKLWRTRGATVCAQRGPLYRAADSGAPSGRTALKPWTQG